MTEQNENMLRIKTRIWLGKNRTFLGPGGIELLHQIEQVGNVREACEKMELSYSKGRKIIRSMEEELGQSVVIRQAGGVGGGGARLTERGRSLIRLYEETSREVAEYAEQAFEKKLAGWLDCSARR